ncbi:hypothetical protein CISIN_1g042374mg, partial [Citrus sinensis]
MNGQIVIPVFYHVDPSDVRKQSGSFGEAFVEYEKNFPHKVQKWRDALTEASNSTDLDGFVGLNSRIEEVKSLLCLESRDVRIVGIWGMGGIGKTTIASAVFHQISRHFQGKCFMANVREESNKMGAIHVRDEVISQVLGDKNLKIGTLVIHQNIRKRLRQVKMLIVLDAVHDGFTQLESLAGELDKFTTGSRIIITTRDKQVLDKCGVNYVYEVEGLEHNKAFELFYRKAFRQNNYPPDFLGLSLEVVHYARNNPLALEVLGSSLYQKSKQQWEDRLHNLRLISEPNIYKVLKISYDELNSKEKEMFLDIACFFKGEDLDLGTDNIEGIFLNLSKINDLHLSPQAFAKMSNLRLLKFYMPEHDGVPITSSKVHLDQGLEYLPEELRYLHWHEYPLKTLPFDFEPENLTELSLPYSKVEQSWGGKRLLSSKFIDLSHSQYLIRMPDLSEAPNLERINLLNCTNLVSVPSSIQNFNHLSMLCFEGCKSLRSFPSNLHFVCPVTINCGGCVNLTEFPQISGSVTKLILWETAIKEVPSSVGCLTNLKVLSLSQCPRLKRISTSILKLKSLQNLYLIQCFDLENFPEILEKMEYLNYNALGRTKIRELPSTFEKGEGTESQLPSSVADTNDLEGLSLYLRNYALNGCLSSLEYLDLSGNDFESLPASIKQLSRLRKLHLCYCDKLQSIPELPLSLKWLDASNCERLQTFPEISSYLEE